MLKDLLFPRGVAVIAGSKKGIELAKVVNRSLKHSYFLGEYSEEVVRQAFKCFDGVILIMSFSGAVRVVCKYSTKKGEDPAVVAVDSSGKFAIPVVNSHWGGNELASLVANSVGGSAILNTQAEEVGIRPLEHLAKLLYAKFEDVGKLAKVYSHVLDGGILCAENFDPPSGFDYVVTRGNCSFTVKLGRGCKEDELCLIPYELFVGVGLKDEARDIEDRVPGILAQYGVPLSRVKGIASIKERAKSVADKLNLPFRLFSVDELNSLDHDCLSPPSDKLREEGIRGVAEASALMMAGKGARLLLRKVKAHDLTVAVAGVVDV
ncbi:cobalamin biosynthesis protein CbiG [Metallosphaera yellowstonensis MK1]|uniref:Cobalamin biosynthesis protein CbiG n=1 Tax=Metallosphaera yellowstonensis MK1 TaxID=671065 RepID=H2C639_9CREN|nr:cobalamin biosynthesis protein [Metallosphaera yellowstonensis]EHP69266.1 cobalamin biosynthesis protein CbiG [Metallosphaera yellowstonensis MK1]